jgi:hypothetical protein
LPVILYIIEMEFLKYIDAIEFATIAHDGQYRKGLRLPYIVHPLGVAKILIEYSCSPEIIIAGILHDVVEDTPVSLEEIRNRFGQKVAILVESVTEPDKCLAWEKRKQHTVEFLKTASLDVLLLACADKLDNIRSIQNGLKKTGEAIWAKFKRSRTHQHWYYGTLADIFIAQVNDSSQTELFKIYYQEVQLLFKETKAKNQFDVKDSLELGKKAEEIFIRMASQRGYAIEYASQENNINNHWDFEIAKADQCYRVDVKAMKRIRRHDPEVQDNWLWIELHSVRPYNRGWLYDGMADLLAIETRRSFLLVERVKLIQLVEQVIDFDKIVKSPTEARYKIYSRPNRYDKISLIETEKLTSIQWDRWEK